MEEKDKSLFKYNGKTYKLIKQPKEGKSCKEFCSLHNYGCEKLCVKAYNELDNPDFGLIEAVFVEVDEAGYKETGMKENEIDQKEQKATWSEDDEETLNSAISFVEHSAFTTIGKGRNYVISWLKSLKERIQLV